MEVFITGLHITLCFFLILVVLLQPGKGADFGAAMGGASQEVFGASGGISLLSKITATVAALFMTTSLALAWFSNTPPGTDLTPEELMRGVDSSGNEGGASGAALPSEEGSAPAETESDPAGTPEDSPLPTEEQATEGAEASEPVEEPSANSQGQLASEQESETTQQQDTTEPAAVPEGNDSTATDKAATSP